MRRTFNFTFKGFSAFTICIALVAGLHERFKYIGKLAAALRDASEVERKLAAGLRDASEVERKLAARPREQFPRGGSLPHVSENNCAVQRRLRIL